MMATQTWKKGRKQPKLVFQQCRHFLTLGPLPEAARPFPYKPCHWLVKPSKIADIRCHPIKRLVPLPQTFTSDRAGSPMSV